MFLLYLFVCNCTCECMFCVGDHLVQAVLPFVLPIFGKIDNNNNNNNNYEFYYTCNFFCKRLRYSNRAVNLFVVLCTHQR